MSSRIINSDFKVSKENRSLNYSDHNISFQTESEDQKRQNNPDEALGPREESTQSIDGLYGNHETQVSEGGEADLHKQRNGCKKNPGHTKFIPVDTFTLNHLPEGHRDQDLFKYIKATADLAVRVDVKMTSPHRPEFWQNTKVSYPMYNLSGKTNLKYGSGTVNEVNMFIDGYRDGVEYSDEDERKHKKGYTTCWCRKCQHSDTASHVWWEFDVFTATHVVFDDIEASHTSLRLFYDREDCPVVSVDQVSVVGVDIERDFCLLKCVTCDENLGDKLDMLWRHFVNARKKVLGKYRESQDKLSFIVSHPHGCSKQVSVGQWVDRHKVGKYKFKIPIQHVNVQEVVEPESIVWGREVLVCGGSINMSTVEVSILNLITARPGELLVNKQYGGVGFILMST